MLQQKRCNTYRLRSKRFLQSYLNIKITVTYNKIKKLRLAKCQTQDEKEAAKEENNPNY